MRCWAAQFAHLPCADEQYDFLLQSLEDLLGQVHRYGADRYRAASNPGFSPHRLAHAEGCVQERVEDDAGGFLGDGHLISCLDLAQNLRFTPPPWIQAGGDPEDVLPRLRFRYERRGFPRIPSGGVRELGKKNFQVEDGPFHLPADRVDLEPGWQVETIMFSFKEEGPVRRPGRPPGPSVLKSNLSRTSMGAVLWFNPRTMSSISFPLHPKLNGVRGEDRALPERQIGWARNPPMAMMAAFRPLPPHDQSLVEEGRVTRNQVKRDRFLWSVPAPVPAPGVFRPDGPVMIPGFKRGNPKARDR